MTFVFGIAGACIDPNDDGLIVDGSAKPLIPGIAGPLSTLPDGGLLYVSFVEGS